LRRTYHPLARSVLRRGLALCLLLEAVALALLWRAGQAGREAALYYDYARQFLLAALTAFGCALPGSLLMEDLLRYYGDQDPPGRP